MDKAKYNLTGLLLSALALLSSCQSSPTRNRINQNNFPPVILWAWERPENLEFIDPSRFGVAFLAQTLTLKDDSVVFTPRRQPLRVNPLSKLIAVTRIESRKTSRQHVGLTIAQRRETVQRIRKTLELENVSAIQVDFDAVTSERTFYRELLTELRSELPADIPISITALASFCVGDPWLKDLPVDEAVPMAFRMGKDSDQIKGLLKNGGDFRGELCQRSYGVALDEPVTTSFQNQRRVYVFNARAWTESDVAEVAGRFGQ
jgi:hypothetical protein